MESERDDCWLVPVAARARLNDAPFVLRYKADEGQVVSCQFVVARCHATDVRRQQPARPHR
jgi:hypothetical protein